MRWFSSIKQSIFTKRVGACIPLFYGIFYYAPRITSADSSPLLSHSTSPNNLDTIKLTPASKTEDLLLKTNAILLQMNEPVKPESELAEEGSKRPYAQIYIEKLSESWGSQLDLPYILRYTTKDLYKKEDVATKEALENLTKTYLMYHLLTTLLLNPFQLDAFKIKKPVDSSRMRTATVSVQWKLDPNSVPFELIFLWRRSDIKSNWYLYDVTTHGLSLLLEPAQTIYQEQLDNGGLPNLIQFLKESIETSEMNLQEQLS